MLSFKKASTIQLQLSNPKSKFYGGDKIEVNCKEFLQLHLSRSAALLC